MNSLDLHYLGSLRFGQLAIQPTFYDYLEHLRSQELALPDSANLGHQYYLKKNSIDFVFGFVTLAVKTCLSFPEVLISLLLIPNCSELFKAKK